jgi:hypothetical protein
MNVKNLDPEKHARLDAVEAGTDDTLTAEEWATVPERTEAHRRDPSTAIPIEKVKVKADLR